MEKCRILSAVGQSNRTMKRRKSILNWEAITEIKSKSFWFIWGSVRLSKSEKWVEKIDPLNKLTH